MTTIDAIQMQHEVNTWWVDQRKTQEETPSTKKKNKRCLLESYPVPIGTTVTLPVTGPVRDDIPATTSLTLAGDLSIILDHFTEEKFKGWRGVRIIACRLYELLSDHRVCFCGTRFPYHVVDDVKQCLVSVEDKGVN